jgi:hypothetical protein
LGDAIGAGIVYHLSKEQLEEMDVNGIESVPEQNGTAIKENAKTNPAYDDGFLDGLKEISRYILKIFHHMLDLFYHFL